MALQKHQKNCFLSAKTLTVTRKDVGLAEIGFGTIHARFKEGATIPKRSKYIKWNERDQHETGKYASTNGGCCKKIQTFSRSQ